ncbi:hypothetical protein SO802_007335 [Lithocarpus litseifolius]|uniref:RING-type domain-containing protein n=1 Tax=Lithocarpus litseifolius TaxID=425828 RepID=A0AAW2DQX5_9ROSI
MSQLGVILQESVVRERETRTILCFLREQMDGVDGARRRRRSLKERLGLKGMGCCGTTWVFGGTNARDNNVVVDDDDDDEEEDVVVIDVGLGQAPPGQNPDPLCVSPVSSASGMNLAAALAAERHLRASHEPERVATVGPTDTVVGTVGTTTAPGTPFRVSLMRLLEETDGGDEETTMMTEKEKEREKGGVEGNDSVCCVCMVRKKGAAFIPCGHTFCRVCSRELWLNRGSCPLCNRSILEILDIF